MPFGKGSTAVIYWWDYTVAKDRVRTRLSHGEANYMWGVHSNVQQIYNGFTNEWDICTDFGDDPTGLKSDEDEILYAEGPIDNKDLMDIGPPSTPSAPPLETTDKTLISTELFLAVQFKAASQDPNTIEDSMDIGSPSACSPLQPGTIDWDPKAAESPLIPLVQSLNTASQDLTAIKNPVDLEAPSVPTNQDSTTDKQAQMAAKPSSPSSVLHIELLSEKTLAPLPAGPSGISLTKVCEPEWVEKTTSHGSSLYKHKIEKKIERLLPPSSPLSHMPTSVPMSTST